MFATFDNAVYRSGAMGLERPKLTTPRLYVQNLQLA
jgi:hypothetical protein